MNKKKSNNLEEIQSLKQSIGKMQEQIKLLIEFAMMAEITLETLSNQTLNENSLSFPNKKENIMRYWV